MAQEFHNDAPTSRTTRNDPPVIIQVLSVIAFGVFSIVAVSLAFAAFWVAGLIVAAVIGWTWAGSRMFGSRRDGSQNGASQTIRAVAPTMAPQKRSGNASFDAYRENMLEQLEQESRNFDSFLGRLRDARDASEFDAFLDERAMSAKLARDIDIEDEEYAEDTETVKA